MTGVRDSGAGVPLKPWQALWLFAGTWPALFFTGALVLYLAVLRDLVGGRTLPLTAFLLVVIAAMGYRAVLRVRDLLSGRALVADDVLVRTWRTGIRGPGATRCYGQFEQLGRHRLMTRVFHRTHAGHRYRVVYSPVSRIVWSAEPL